MIQNTIIARQNLMDRQNNQQSHLDKNQTFKIQQQILQTVQLQENSQYQTNMTHKSQSINPIHIQQNIQKSSSDVEASAAEIIQINPQLTQDNATQIDQQIRQQNQISPVLIQQPNIQITSKQPLIIKSQDQDYIQLNESTRNKQTQVNSQTTIISKNQPQQSTIILKKQLKLTKVYELKCSSLQNNISTQPSQNKNKNIIQIQQQKKQIKQPLKVLLSGKKSIVQIKTPQVVGQKKLKPWERMKKPMSVVINKETQETKKDVIESPEKSETKNNANSQIHEKMNDFFNIKQNQEQIINKILQNKNKQTQISSEKIKQLPLSQPQKTQTLIQSQHKSLAQNSNRQFKETQVHETKNNPLFRHFQIDAVKSQPEKSSQSTQNNPLSAAIAKQEIKSQQSQIRQGSQNTEKLQVKKEDQQNNNTFQYGKMQDYMKYRIPEAHNQSQSQSQQQNKLHQQMNKKKLQIQQSRRKRKIQLELQLKLQKQINQQLQQSTSLSFKLMASTIAGASISGLSWLIKKNRSSSIMFGLATTIATFIISN